MVYIDEYKTLRAINNCLKNFSPSMDIDTYELIEAFVENPYNTSKEEYQQIQDFINENTKITEEFAVYYNIDLAEKFKHIGPYKPSLPLARVKKVTFKKESIPAEAKIISVDFKPEPKTTSKVFKKAA